MDLLASLHIAELPEHQTRVAHLVQENPDFALHLGIDACCTCGQSLNDVSLACSTCQRVWYCSDSCRVQDTQALAYGNVETDDELAMGHSSVVCALLRLARIDEAVDPNVDFGDSDSAVGGMISATERQASIDRIQSEYESYPATLANVLLQPGVSCYQPVLQSCRGQTLVLLLIGAAQDGELWNAKSDNEKGQQRVVSAYAEALVDLADKYQLREIDMRMIGPDCPDPPWDLRQALAPAFSSSFNKNSSSGDPPGQIHLQTHKTVFLKETQDNAVVPIPHIVVFFNAGFTVPDYDWAASVKAVPDGTPFLSTSNTEMEGLADCQYLLDQDKIKSIPYALARGLGLTGPPDENENDVTMEEACFFSENPFAGNRVRQSNSMANDLYVKNRWMLGGVMASFEPETSNDGAAIKRAKVGNDDALI